MEKFIKDQLSMLDRASIATPTEKYLESFTKANGGSNDFLLMQLAKNYGYQLALRSMASELKINLNE